MGMQSRLKTFNSQLTVKDALQLEILKGSKVVAGQDGLDRVIEWVHNVGVPDAARWLNGGELVLTTAINLPADIEDQKEYMLAVIKKNIAALGIAVGRYWDDIPQHLIDIANKYQFPLLAIPFDIYFVEIAREINQIISQSELRHALAIHQSLTQLVVDGAGLNELAVTLANLVNQSVSIENERFEAYASVNIAEVDEARVYTQQYGRTDPRLVKALEERGYIPEIHETLRPVSLPQMPDVGLEMERILAPIVVNGEVIGYMWIIADNRPLSDLERLAIESGSTVAALMLLRQEAIQRDEASQRGDLLASLMQSDAINREQYLLDRALRYGINLHQPYRVLLVQSGQKSTLALYHSLNQRLRMLNPQVVLGRFAGQFMLFVPQHQELQAIFDNVYSTFVDDNGLQIGVSALHRGVVEFSEAYGEARETLLIAQRLKQSDRVIYFDNLGYLHTLYRAGEDSLNRNAHASCLRQLLKENQTDLFHTLEVYLDAGGNGVATAELLHIHRSTLNYRLARVSEICQVDLSDALTRTNLQIALKMVRLFDMT